MASYESFGANRRDSLSPSPMMDDHAWRAGTVASPEREPLLGSKQMLPAANDQARSEEGDGQKRKNMLIMLVASSLMMLGYGVYGVAYSQWIYVRFEMDAMGSNFSKLNQSASTDPCFRGNRTDSPFKAQLLEAQTNSAHFGVLTTAVSLVPSFFVNLLLGAYSDQIGRRLIFIVPMAGNVARTAIVTAVAFWDLSVNYILVGYTVYGLTGDYIAFIMAVFVYTADNTTAGRDRSFLMVVAQGVITVCFYLSQLATGYYIEALGYVWPMVTGLAGIVAAFLFVLFFLRETLDKSKVERVSLMQGIRGVFSFYFQKPTHPLHKRKDFILLGLIFFVYAISYGNSISTIFLMNEPFCWGSRQIGYVSSAFGLGHTLLSTGLMKLLQMVLSDELVCVICLLSATANRFLLAFAYYDWEIYSAYGAGSMESPVLPIIRAILSRMVRPQNRGSLFASIAVIETATIAVSGAGLGELYADTVDRWRGLTYFVVGCIIFSSAVLMLVYKGVLTQRQPHQTTSVPGTNGQINSSDSDTEAIS